MLSASPRSALIAAMVFGIADEAQAQSLAGVPGAEINHGERTLDYRAGDSLPDDGRDFRFGHRLHYQHAINGDWRVRLLVQQVENGSGGLATQFVSLQSQHQLIDPKRSGGWASAARVDGFIPVDDIPGRARLVLLNSFDFASGVQIRGDMFFAREFGDSRAAGIDFETRAEISAPATARTRVGAQLYNRWNSTADFGAFDDQRHQAALFVRSRLTKQLGLEAGWLFGLSEAAADADFRVILTWAL